MAYCVPKAVDITERLRQQSLDAIIKSGCQHGTRQAGLLLPSDTPWFTQANTDEIWTRVRLRLERDVKMCPNRFNDENADERRQHQIQTDWETAKNGTVWLLSSNR
ncbi:uncharacterized protein LOC125377987 [Haliotis rufescens]|uniref:uncharacterized protein LOC125377987 n=1 Tax=Haliotis rufescens TaxID=6454 RepID=UPI00201E9E34|nr:uncharacterized protein LOC125377987 [Haliotis rufescens]